MVYKILSKIMVNRLVSLMEKFISEEQSTFPKGQNIFYNIAIAQELVYDMNR